MNKLKRSRVVDGKIRPVTNAQHGGLLQLIIAQSHDAALAVFVERSRGFVEKHPSGFVQEEPREGEALLLAGRSPSGSSRSPSSAQNSPTKTVESDISIWAKGDFSIWRLHELLQPS
jgi:hypothetical protein